ncbi:hypothetical protein ACS0TY_029673 [Phlomoides rotata]
MGFGTIIHDDNGDFVVCRSLVIPGVFRVDMGEAMGLLEVLSWVKQLGFQHAKIEVDAKLVVDALKTQTGGVCVWPIEWYLHVLIKFGLSLKKNT